MFQRLVELHPLPETEPQRLATRRAQSIVEYLIQSAGVDPVASSPEKSAP